MECCGTGVVVSGSWFSTSDRTSTQPALYGCERANVKCLNRAIFVDHGHYVYSYRLNRQKYRTQLLTFTDFQVRIVCTSDVPHTQIFRADEGHSEFVDKDSLMLMDDLGLKEKNKGTKDMNIFTGEEEAFAFDRTVSRLTQMMTPEYWEEYNHQRR